MQTYRKILDKLDEHLGGDRKAMYIVLCLFAAGMLIFIVNSVILLSSPERAYRTLRVVLKAETALMWTAAAVIGTMYYPTKRNRLLMHTLVWYMLGDIAVMYSYPVGGVLYCIGHLILTWAILETTYIRKWQCILLVVFFITHTACGSGA